MAASDSKLDREVVWRAQLFQVHAKSEKKAIFTNKYRQPSRASQSDLPLHRLALYRIEEITRLHEDAVYPDDFDLDDKAARGVWDFGSGEKIQITLRFTAEAGEHLNETPLSTDQTIELPEDGHLVLKATVPNAPQLHWWIQGFGVK